MDVEMTIYAVIAGFIGYLLGIFITYELKCFLAHRRIKKQ